MILQQIEQDIKQAMLDKTPVKLQALRSLKAAFIKAKTDQQRSNPSEELSEQEEISVVRKQIKQRKESADIYTNQGRTDLAGVEIAEQFFLEQYAPIEISEDAIRSSVANAILEVQVEIKGIATMRNMKDVIAKVKAQYPGADSATVSKSAKNMLTSIQL
jgi:uncharacterized protein YqeY